MDIRWQRNDFVTLYAKMKIRLGGPHNVTIDKGEQVQYDGTLLKYAGMDLPIGPSLRSSVNQGWFTDDEAEIDGHVAAVVPSRQVAKSQTKNTDLQRVQRHEANSMETDSMDEDTVMHVSDRRPEARTDQHNPGGRNIRAQPRVITSANRPQPKKTGWKSSGLVVNPGAIEEQDYTPVARLRTPANAGKIDMTSAGASQLKHRLDNIAGSGAIPLHPQYEETQQEGINIRTTSRMNRNAPVEIGDENEGTVVGKVRHSSRGMGNAEGVSVADTSNIRAERAATKNGKTVKATSKDVKIDTKLPPKIRMARRIDPDFPADWNFTGKLKDRMDAVKKHGASQQFLEALYAAEGDQMRLQLEKAYPKQFGG
jgi:hypothetical protein